MTLLLCPAYLSAGSTESLSAALAAAENGVVNLDPGLTYVGNAGVTSDLVINGNGATIDLATAQGFRTFRFQADTTVTLNDVTIRNADVCVDVKDRGVANFNNVTFSSSDAAITHAGDGGSVNLFNCTFVSISNDVVNLNYADFPTGPSIMLENTTMNGGNTGVIARSGDITSIESDFSNLSQALSHGGSGGTIRVENSRFLNISSQAINANFTSAAIGPEIIVSGTNQFDQCGTAIINRGGTNTINGAMFTDVTQAIVFSGGEGTTVTSTTINGFRDQAIQGDSFGGIAPNLTLNGCEFNDGGFGVQLRNGSISVENCDFSNLEQGLALLEGLNSEETPAIIRNSTFSAINQFAVIVKNGGFIDIDDIEITDSKVGLEFENGTVATVNNVTIDSGSFVQDVGPAIAVLSGSELELRDSHLIRHLNSVDMRQSKAIVEDCILDNPFFSGVICVDNSELEIRRCDIPDNGQDGIFTAIENETSGAILEPSRGLIEDCVITNAGDEPPNAAVGLNEQAGTGIALGGGGPWEVRRCTIINSFDVGMTLRNNLEATVENIVILRNQKSGMAITAENSVTIRDVLIAGHTSPDQSGLIIDGNQEVQATLDRVAILDNTFGIIYAANGNTVQLNDCLVAANIGQGISINNNVFNGNGALTTERTGIFNNGDFQVFVTSAGQPVLRNGLIWGENTKGLFTDRGLCGEASGLKTIATDNYWGTPDGPIDGCLEPIRDGYVDVQNTNYEPFLSEGTMEIYTTFFGEGEDYISRDGPSRWLTLTGIENTPFGEPLAIMRQLGRLGTPAPADAVEETFITWSSDRIRSSGSTLTFEISNPPAAGPLFNFQRVNPDTGETLASFPAVSNDTSLFISIPAEEFINGTWYLTRENDAVTPVLLGKDAGTLDSDLNDDGVLDAADALLESGSF